MFANRLLTHHRAHLAILLLTGSALITACGARTEEGDSGGQPIFNANGDLISGGDGSIPTLGEASPLDELSLRVISDVNSIATGGTDVATIKATVIDANNNAVADNEVTFSSTGGVLQNISGTTDANGEASATLNLPQDFRNQEIIVTASSDFFESSVNVIATGSELAVTGPDNLIAGDVAELVFRLTAGNGEPIANQQLALISDAGNTIAPEQITTDADGQVQVNVGSANASDTIRATALDGTVSVSHSFEVVADLLSFVNISEAAELVVGSESLIRVNWISQGLPVVGEALSFSMTAGRIQGPSVVLTDSEGNAAVRVSSDSTGLAQITVEAAQGGAPRTDTDIEFIATTPDSVTVDASSSLVNVNETSTITALVKDRLGNPVKNSEVNFAGDDLKGGQLNPAAAITNSAGIASVMFTAGDSATQADEISVRASVEGHDITDAISLSVFKRALNITLGSSNLITIKPLGTQYAKPFLVQVSDGSGTPLESATVKVSVRPLWYGKGFMELVDENGDNRMEAAAAGDQFNAVEWALSGESITCPAEDLDGDRTLDTLGAVSEDFNNNGTLDPQDPASLTAIEGDYATLSGGSLITDQNGSGFFELLYPASNAIWSYVEITARAEALGAEATDTYRTFLSMPAEAVNDTDQAPANAISPYGVDNDATVVRSVVSNGTEMDVLAGCTTTN